jgi:sigma-B regulation protein RsbU (phosphoserine phosphatase)
MTEAVLAIRGNGETQEVRLHPEGTMVGRSPQCDVVIDSQDVSRQHARIFKDPFGRWIVEDLNSSNGTFINGKRIEVAPILPAETVVIGAASLYISEPVDQQVQADTLAEHPNIVVEDFGMEVFQAQGKPAGVSARPCPKLLDEITMRLSKVKCLPALYPELCVCLARGPSTAAAILRVPGKNRPIPKTPEVLAWHFGVRPDDTVMRGAQGSCPTHLAFRISRRLLESARSGDLPVMAKSVFSPDTQVTITLIEEHSPRATICAPLEHNDGLVDLLYVDMPIDGNARISPEEMFALVCAVAQEVVSARKSLAPAHLRSERRALDHELRLAHELQTRLAPAQPADVAGVEVAVVYSPVSWVGGDYCDIWVLDESRLALALGHVSEKGLPAAMAISNLRTLLRTTMSFTRELSEVTRHVNSHLNSGMAEGLSAALFFGVLDWVTGDMNYVNIAHPEPIIAHPKLGVRPLGIAPDAVPGVGELTVPTSVETIPSDGVLVVFSQGVLNAQSPEGERFGVKRLIHSMKATECRSAQHVANSITDVLSRFRQNLAQQDDISVLVLIRR